MSDFFSSIIVVVMMFWFILIAKIFDLSEQFINASVQSLKDPKFSMEWLEKSLLGNLIGIFLIDKHGISKTEEAVVFLDGMVIGHLGLSHDRQRQKLAWQELTWVGGSWLKKHLQPSSR